MRERCRRTSPGNLDMTKPRLSVGVATAGSKVFLRTGACALARILPRIKADGETHQARSMAVLRAPRSPSTAAQAATTNGSSVPGGLLALLAAGTMAPSVWPAG